MAQSTISIAAKAAESSGSVTPYVARVGLALFVAIVILIVVVCAGIFAFAIDTQPSLVLAQSLQPDTAKQFDSYTQLQTTWFNQTKDLLQILVVALLIPLLASIAGYIFGKTQGESK